jgi:hypothetical protein
MESSSIVKYENKLWLRITYKILNSSLCGLLHYYDKYYLLEQKQHLVKPSETKWGQVSISKFQESINGALEIIEKDSKKKTIKKSRSESDLIRLRNEPSSIMVNMVDYVDIEEIPTLLHKGTAWAKIKFKKNKLNGRTYKVLKFALFEKDRFHRFIKVPLNIKIVNY